MRLAIKRSQWVTGRHPVSFDWKMNFLHHILLEGKNGDTSFPTLNHFRQSGDPQFLGGVICDLVK